MWDKAQKGVFPSFSPSNQRNCIIGWKGMATMLLTLTTTAPEATDLGYLLHKNPANVHEREIAYGQVIVFYPEATPERCTVALLVDVDPVALVRGSGGAGGRPAGSGAGALDQYVNDRPYAASSLLSSAIAEAFGTALNGRSKHRPERVGEAMPLEIRLDVVRCRGDEGLIRELFEPLGYEVEAIPHPLDEHFPDWDPAGLFTLTLRGRRTIQECLSHLYVLVPVLDNRKHYYISDAEVDKLLAKGEGWLPRHPRRDLIVQRYLRYRASMVRRAREVLAAVTDDGADPAETDEARQAEEDRLEMLALADRQGPSLNEQRLGAVLAALKEPGTEVRRVLDLGCGEGCLLALLLKEGQFHQVVGVDVSSLGLARAEARLNLDRLPPSQRERVQLLQGSLVYRDDRFRGFDAAILMEVIEHVDEHRLPALEQVVFGHARPRRVIVTTPNAEFNSRWQTLRPGAFRHGDHRFEWDRQAFRAWTERVARDHGYQARLTGIGPEAPGIGTPTQMAIFDLKGGSPGDDR